MTDDLDPIAPEAAVDLYLDQRRGEVSSETLQSHRYRLEQFVEWCKTEGLANMNDVGGRDLHSYRVARREEGGLKPVTLQGQLSTLRVFLGFCASIDAVPEGLRSKVLLPTVSNEDQASETSLNAARAENALEYLDRYQYASREHVILLLLWQTGMRLGHFVPSTSTTANLTQIRQCTSSIDRSKTRRSRTASRANGGSLSRCISPTSSKTTSTAHGRT